MKTTYIILLLTIVLSVASCGDHTKEQSINSNDAVSVTVSSTALENSIPFLTASGKIEAVNSANLSTRLMGYVNKVHVNVGDKVSKGQLLISINNVDLMAKNAQVNAGITEASVAFANAEKDYNRFKNLFAENSASQKELDDMTAQYEMAKARLESAKQIKNEVASQFSYANIRAPFAGVITNQFIDEGAMANPGFPLIALEAPGNFEVAAMVPESEISQIEPDSEVTVSIKSVNKIIKGRVTELSPSARNTGGQYLVKIALDKTDTPILSGMYATVQFPIENKAGSTNAIMIPEEVLVKNGQLSGVYTVSSRNTALLRWLRLGRTFGTNVEVLSGLSKDETYIVSADGKLYNGAPISIKE